MSFLENIVHKVVGDPNDKELKNLQPLIDQINQLESEMQQLSDSDFPAKIQEFKAKFTPDQSPEDQKAILDEIMISALALAREAANRVLGLRAFDVQLMGAIALHQGKIAEMKTGEGKTLVGLLASVLRALPDRGVHIVTVNEYLAQRDSEEMGRVLEFLGLTVGCLKAQTPPEIKKTQYAADVTYGTNNEFGFDYLRDNMAQKLEDQVQRGHHFAIIDEVDSILIDEARTPLIISAPAEEATSQYLSFAKTIQGLQKGTHFEIDEKQKAVTLTEAGIAELERRLGVDNIYTDKGFNAVHHLEQALRAHALFQRDKDYVVQDGQVMIVDEFTGRLMPGRRFSDGLHQAIEAKEGVDIKRESKTLATITFQHYFRLYQTLSGMTGTAKTEEEEFAKIYHLPVLVIPTNRPMIRDDKSDLIFRTEKGKFSAAVREIQKLHEAKQPVLVGTISVEKSEYLSELLKREGIKHEVLNAKNHAREAEIVANAGKLGAVTIATNMAGRGTDIKIGGPDRTSDQLDEVAKTGGLHILGTERHESRRIDNQLRGRSGRQGEPGSSQFFVSLDDDLMRIFGGARVQAIMDKLNFPEDEPLENSILNNSIESAQKRVEGHHFDMRKRLFEFDSVIHKHRERIFTRRQNLLENDPTPEIHELISAEIQARIQNAQASENPTESKAKLLSPLFPNASVDFKDSTADSLAQAFQASLENKLKPLPESDQQKILRFAVLRNLDHLWMQHIDTVARLRENVSLQAFGQRDPLMIFKKESFELFQRLTADIQSQTVSLLANLEVKPAETAPAPFPQTQTNEADITEAADGDFEEDKTAAPTEITPTQKSVTKVSLDETPAPKSAPTPQKAPTRISLDDETPSPNPTPTPSNMTRVSADSPVQTSGPHADPKFKNVGRNEPCPCGSGKKFKKCCGQG